MTDSRSTEKVMRDTTNDCANNPHGTGHCEHTSVQNRTSGTYFITKCCWCGRHNESRMNLPEHGKHA